ncbi:hypothetical protein [Amycolatopsis sp. FDAARGOS 1241]|uniref:hypothetical protein n=1 Tax=Amycolatopsis sp. FDAARGOS 1241 TaxID=2778070 RepID=UPI00194E43BF|nr:hypothetical protein [Amycolatopsis sp. FDAARGOS 1241]QRP48235.1 hypothetical protein I6J71_10350 [Amycolatopsis sp. FDAARGOS 1241]
MATDTVGTAGKQAQPRTTRVRFPFGHAVFRAPDVHLPRIPKPARSEVNAALETARSFLPPRRQLLYFGALGVLTAVELIEWPVAIAIGVGTAVAAAGGESRGAAPRSAPDAQPKPVEQRATTAGQAEITPANLPPRRAAAGERPAMAGQPEVAGAHHPLEERKPPRVPPPKPDAAPQKPPPAQAKPAAARPPTRTWPRAAPKQPEQGS